MKTRLIGRGEIVDIRWGDQRDRTWLRQHVPSRFWRELPQLPQSIRREMSVYRCRECGEFGVLGGIGQETLLVWTLKKRLCAACSGCNCTDCLEQRAHAGVDP